MEEAAGGVMVHPSPLLRAGAVAAAGADVEGELDRLTRYMTFLEKTGAPTA
jgi:hypothetical protein